MNNTNRKNLLTGLVLCLASVVALAQPVFDTGKEVQGIIVYQDLMQKSKYYYVPHDLELGKNNDGSPMFKYLKMANSKLNKTGTSAQLKDLNLIQITLKNLQINPEKLVQLKEALGGKHTQLVSMPTNKFEFTLLEGIESVGSAKTLGNHLNASFENSGSGLWQQKNITIQLSRAASSLIDQHILDFGQPGIRFTYSYYSDFVTGIDEVYKSNEAAFDSPKKDTTISKLAYKTAVFDLNIDINKWGEKCIKEIVLNEAVLPRYIPLQVSCYDFSDDLRPDLMVKRVQVCGDGLQRQNNCEVLDFNHQQPDINAYSLRFKSPVLMTNPLRYQVTEISSSGKIHTSEWATIPAGESINITSAKNEQKFRNQTVEFEIDLNEMESAGYQSVKIQLSYLVNQQPKQKDLIIDLTEESNYLATNFFCDKDTPVKYVLKWMSEATTLKVENSKTIDSDYIYLKPTP